MKINCRCTGINGFVFSNPKTFTTSDLSGEPVESHNITNGSLMVQLLL